MMKIKVVMSVLLLALAGCSMDQPGVQPDNRRPCPECPECDECSTDRPDPDDPCEGVSFEGQCTEDGNVQWCQDGELMELDCAADGSVCGFDEGPQFFDCLPGSEDPESGNSAMEFTCACGQILLDVQFALGEDDGCIKGVLGHVTPEQVSKVKFFIDEQDIATAPSANYNVEGNSATLELPGCSVTGNLFLVLRDDSTAWVDVGYWELTGASVSGSYLVASCGQDSECYCQ